MLHSNDKYIISEFHGFEVDKKLIKEAIETNSTISISCILQKANTLNRNGRVYPFKILKREVDKYMELVRERSAMGECVPAGTQIYTESGWRNIEDVKIGDKVFTLNLKNNKIENQSTVGTIKKQYSDDMIHIYNNDIDMMLTKKHKLIIWDKNDKCHVLTAEEFYNQLKSGNNFQDFYFRNNINSENKSIINQPVIYLNNLQSDLIKYNDFVYCISVPNQTWLMQYNNKTIWTHNCDHPDCNSSDTQILTENGWQFLPDISDTEKVYTLNVETNQIELQQIEKKIDQAYKGLMYHVHNRFVDQLVTPNHRFLIEDSSGKSFYKTAEELFTYRSNKWRIPKKGIWSGNNDEYFILEGIKNFSKQISHELIDKYSKDIKINSKDWFAFLGIYLAEGCATGTKGSARKNFQIKITQKNENKKQLIRDLFKRLPFEFREWNFNSNEGKVDFIIHDARLHQYLLKLGHSHTKYIPQDIKQASPELLSILLEWFHLGDGKTRSIRGGKSIAKEVFSTSKRLIEDMQEILLKSGGHGNITTEEPKDRLINDISFVEKEIDNQDGTLSIIKERVLTPRLIKAINSKTKYYLHFSTSDHIYLDPRFFHVDKVEDFDDRVYCVRVPNGNFYTMRNGKSHWVGNSAVISLANVSHLVTEMWWEGETLYGKVEIADTPSGNIVKGLLKSGIKLGISSRGVGSVKSSNDKDVVQEDFELIAFDIVSSPSTPGAYLFKEGRQWGMKKLTSEDMKNVKVDDFKSMHKDAYKKIIDLSEENFWKNK